LFGFGAASVGAVFDLVPIFCPRFAPRHWTLAVLTSFLGKRGLCVSFFFHSDLSATPMLKAKQEGLFGNESEILIRSLK
jgi:hypothetical protein